MSENFSKWLNDQSLTVKYIFDHLRNIGLCALILGSAIFLIKADDTIVSLPFVSPSIAGWFLLPIGFALALINSTQFALIAATAAAKFKLSKPRTGIAVFLITGWSQFLASYLLLAQFSRMMS